MVLKQRGGGGTRRRGQGGGKGTTEGGRPGTLSTQRVKYKTKLSALASGPREGAKHWTAEGDSGHLNEVFDDEEGLNIGGLRKKRRK